MEQLLLPTYFTIIEPAVLSLTTDSTSVTCFGDDDGTATVTPSGGTAPYSYVWTGGPIAPFNTNPSYDRFICRVTFCRCY